jgi:hypothetical protein
VSLGVLGIAILVSSCQAPATEEEAAAKPWVGKWSLVRIVSPEGEELAANGVWHYYADGTFSSQFGLVDRPSLEADPTEADEYQAAFDSYRAGFGTYTVDESGDSLTYEYVGNLRPHRIGQPTVLTIEVFGDTLTARTAEGWAILLTRHAG